MKILILAGGIGSRFWPISRKYYPKQFVQLKKFDYISFYQRTLKRALKIVSKEDIFIITNIDYKFHCVNQAKEINIDISEDQILLEPFQRNTLGAISLGMDKIKDDDNVLVLASDHIIGDDDKFAEEILSVSNYAFDHLIIFGIKPIYPNVGYGYIQFKKSNQIISKVLNFKEKPDFDTAKTYIDKGYYWNSGIFLFSKKIFEQELKKLNKKYYEIIKNGILEKFDLLPDISIDCGIMEKSNNIYMKKLDTYWNDIGSWDSFGAHFDFQNDDVLEIQGKNNFAVSDVDNKKVVFLGTNELIVVDTKDALLISKAGQTQSVKKVVEMLTHQGNHLVEFGKTVYRPWGSYTIIDEGIGFKTKRISVLPGKKLSLQMHYHRSEHWVVVSGTAIIVIGEEEKLLKKGESVYIPIGTKHRLENNGKIILNIIESQIGEYLEEDDIVRFDDDFGRV